MNRSNYLNSSSRMTGTETLQMIFGHKSLMRRWNLLVTLRIYILALAIFSVFRLILFLTELDKVAGQPFITILKAFLMGVRFDIVVTGYIMLLPFVVLSAMQIAQRHNRLVYNLVFLWVLVLFSLAFLICTADIPFFNHFFARFNTSAFLWMDSPSFVFKMILQEPGFSLYIIPFGIVAYLFYRILRGAIAAPSHKTSEGYIGNIAIFILVTGLILLGIRGRVQKKSPIRLGTAYFCENAFLNQLGLNPVFTLMRSYLDDRKEEYRTIKLIDSERAIRNARGYLNLKPVNSDYPIARLIEPADSERNYNVVVIIMESMGLSKMAAGGNPKNLTPFLDSIANRGYFFNNIYTAGIHTFNGIFATICSFPSIYNQHHLKRNPISRYNGIGTTLKSMGYTTAYFTTHDGQFDNVEGFLRANDFEHVITQSDYPPKEVKTTLGVPDDYLFRFSIPIIDQYHAQGKPFLAVYMTASVHEPFYIPPYFTGRQIKEEDRIIEYADWSIRQFIAEASTRSWFDSTLFVMVADHGSALFTNFEFSLDFHRTPLIVYAPKIITTPRTLGQLGGQIDVFPTIMGILGKSYINNTFGIDLLREQRSFVLLNEDDKFSVISNDYLLVVNRDNRKTLYDLKTNMMIDSQSQKSELLEEMELYGRSNLQTFQDMLLNNRTYLDPHELK